VHTIAVQTDGKVIIGGEFAYVNGTAKANLARLNTNGTLDTTFPTSGGVNGPVYALKVQADGRVVVGGNFTNCNGLARNHIARINSNGSQDSTFTSPLAIGSSSVYWIDQQVDAKLIVGGNISTEGGLVRLNTNGTKDATFASGTGFGTGIVHEGIIFNDNSLFVVGDFTTYKGAAANRVAKLTNTGALNSTFNPGSGFNAETLSLAMSFSGHLYSSGGFSSFNGEARNKAAFVNATDGALDTSYVPDPAMSATKIWRIRRVP
jgi:uncharacterized delta-60 repeat protein